MSLESYFSESFRKGARTAKIYQPKVDINIENEITINARIGGLEQNLLNINDIIAWSATNEQRPYGIRGVMAERLLGLVMESFLENFTSKNKGMIKDNKYSGRRADLVTKSSQNYVLKMVGAGNFILLQAPNNETDSYQMERFGYKPTEIDALSYLTYNNKKYLLIGESTTSRSFSLNSWKNGHKINDPVGRIFTPLKELFPEHSLIYFVMAREEYVYSDNRRPRRLKLKPTNLHRKLFVEGIRTIFVPLPKTNPTLDHVATKLASHISIIHDVFYEMGLTKEIIKSRGYKTYPN